MNNEDEYNRKLIKTKQIVDDWIQTCCVPRKDICHKRTGYGLKHALQFDTGVYLFNEDFADAMRRNGFKLKPCQPGESGGENDNFFNVAPKLRKWTGEKIDYNKI